jgi:Tfp pilus assembly protein PilZ
MAGAKRRTAPTGARRFSLRFETLEAFEEQYAQNLVKGGAFVPTDAVVELREIIQVDVELVFSGELLPLAAEVVHCVSADAAPPGVEAGVAVQFLDEAKALREQLEAAAGAGSGVPESITADPPTHDIDAEPELAPAAIDPSTAAADTEQLREPEQYRPAPDPHEFDMSLFDTNALDLGGGEDEFGNLAGIGNPEEVGDPVFATGPPEHERTFTARADRESVRVPVEVRSATGIALRGRTRNLSETGALVSIDGEELAEGRDVTVSLIHPRTGEALKVPGRIARRIEGNGVVCAAAIQLLPDADGRYDLHEFVEEIHEIERTYRQRGIRGHLEELGAVSLIHMFSALAPRGTLTVISGVEEGTIAFEGSHLVLAEVGSVDGVKALARILSWREGRFEFRAQMDAITAERPRTPLEREMEAALAIVEEEGQLAGPSLSSDQRFVVNHQKLGGLDAPLTKSEESVLELAAADFTLRRIMDVIPDNDAQVRAAVLSLTHRGLLTPVPTIRAD